MDDLPKFYTVIRQAEEMLSRSLNGVCKITVHRNLDEKTIKTVRSIDNEKFREELRYSCDELTERVFLCNRVPGWGTHWIRFRLQGSPR
jgi:hypothetical protein